MEKFNGNMNKLNIGKKTVQVKQQDKQAELQWRNADNFPY